jgi:hypothetical protein
MCELRYQIEAGSYWRYSGLSSAFNRKAGSWGLQWPLGLKAGPLMEDVRCLVPWWKTWDVCINASESPSRSNHDHCCSHSGTVTHSLRPGTGWCMCLICWEDTLTLTFYIYSSVHITKYTIYLSPLRYCCPPMMAAILSSALSCLPSTPVSSRLMVLPGLQINQSRHLSLQQPGYIPVPSSQFLAICVNQY